MKQKLKDILKEATESCNKSFFKEKIKDLIISTYGSVEDPDYNEYIYLDLNTIKYLLDPEDVNFEEITLDRINLEL